MPEHKTLYSQLHELEQRLTPTDRAHKAEITAECLQLTKAPNGQDVDKWLEQ